MEKKEIKISLFSFYVLMAGIVFLIGAVILGWMAVGNRNIQEEAGNMVNNQLVQNPNNSPIVNTNEISNEVINQIHSTAEKVYDTNFDIKNQGELVDYLLLDMFYTAEKIYNESPELFNYRAEQGTYIDGWYYAEITNYNEIMNKYFTQKTIEKFENELQNGNHLFKKINGKMYIGEGGSAENASWTNIRIVDKETSENEISATVIVDLMYGLSGKDSKIIENDIREEFRLKKENNLWKIDYYEHTTLYENAYLYKYTGNDDTTQVIQKLKEYDKTLNETNLNGILDGVGLPTLIDFDSTETAENIEKSDKWYLYTDSEILGSLIRMQNIDINNIPNELIVRMGFNLLFASELQYEIENKILQVQSHHDFPITTIPSLDPLQEDYQGQAIVIEFSAEKLNEYITKIFGKDVKYENEEYILSTTCKEFNGPWTDAYAKFNKETNTYTFYRPYEPFGEAWYGLESVITDVNKLEDKIMITTKTALMDAGNMTYYASWTPTISRYQSILYPEMAKKYKVNGYTDEGLGENAVMKLNNYENTAGIYAGLKEAHLPTYQYIFELDKTDGQYYFKSFKKVN